MQNETEKLRLGLVAVLWIGVAGAVYYFHAVLGTGAVVAHLFYLPVILACIWWGRKGLLLALLSIMVLITSRLLFRTETPLANDLLRAFLLFSIAAAIAELSERVSKSLRLRTAAEKELRESEEKFKTIGISALDAIILMDGKGDVSYWNPAAERIFGYRGEEIMGRNVHEILMPEEYRDQFEKGYEGFRQTGTGNAIGKTIELTARRKDGSVFPIEISLSSIQHKDEYQATAIIRDITQRKAADAKYKTLFESSRDAIMLLAPPHWKFTAGNAAAIEMFHAKDEAEFTSNGPGDVSPEYQPNGRPTADEAAKMIGRAMEDGSNFFEWTHKRLDGEEFPATVLLTRIELNGRHLLQATVRDITEEKRAATEREKLLHDAMKRVKEIRCLYAVADVVRQESITEETFRDVAALIPLGWQYPEITRCRILVDGKQTVSEPFEETEWRQSSDIVVHGEKNGSVEVFYLKERPELDEGPFFSEERDLLDGIARMLGEAIENKIGEEEKARAEEQLRQCEDRLKAILESSSLGMMLIDQETRKIVQANSAFRKMVGAEEADIIGKVCHNFLCPNALGQCPILDLGETIAKDERILLATDGQKIPILKEVVPIRIGERDYLLENIVDLRERKALESQLTQAQKLESIGQLAAGIAHEINTPTQYIGDNLNFISDAFQDVQKVLNLFEGLLAAEKEGTVSEEMLDEIDNLLRQVDLPFLYQDLPEALSQSREGVGRVSKIVLAMKEFSHPGSTEKTPVNINQAIESTITVARNEWKYVATMETDFDPSLTEVPCLPGEFNQVILNLLINAAHAIADAVGDGSQGKGVITVSTRKDSPHAEIRIKDTGTGIPPEVQSRIFDPFFTTKKLGQGSGQGLAIARSTIVNKHGGSLTFETEPGQGTSFIVRLPLEAEPGIGDESAFETDISRLEEKNERIQQ